MKQFEEEVNNALVPQTVGEEVLLGTVWRGVISARCKRCRVCRPVELDPELSPEHQQLYSCENTRVRRGPTDVGGFSASVI